MTYKFELTVNAPGLEQAINNLAASIQGAHKQDSSGSAQAASAVPVSVPAPAQPPKSAPVLAPPQIPVPQQAPTVAPMPQAQATAPVSIPAPPISVPQQAAPAPAPQPAYTATVSKPSAAAPATQQGATLDAIINAGASLVEKGMMAQVVALLGKYGLQAVNQLQPAQYAPFAAELRALGANI